MVVHFIENHDIHQIRYHFYKMKNCIIKHLQVFKHHLFSWFGVLFCPEQQVDVYMTSQSPCQSYNSHTNEFKQKRIIGPESAYLLSQNVGKVTKYRCLSGMESKEKSMPEVRNRYVIVPKKKVLNLDFSQKKIFFFNSQINLLNPN